MALAQRRGLGRLRHAVRRPVDQRDPRQPQQPLAEQVIAALRRQGRVDEEAVHRRQPGGAAGANHVGDLRRRGSPGEGQQPVARRVAGQVHQHVDAVSPNPVRDLLVREAHRRAPGVGQPPEPLGDGVGPGHVRIADQLDPAAVVGLQHRLDEEADRVVPEVGRDIAHP